MDTLKQWYLNTLSDVEIRYKIGSVWNWSFTLYAKLTRNSAVIQISLPHQTSESGVWARDKPGSGRIHSLEIRPGFPLSAIVTLETSVLLYTNHLASVPRPSPLRVITCVRFKIGEGLETTRERWRRVQWGRYVLPDAFVVHVDKLGRYFWYKMIDRH